MSISYLLVFTKTPPLIFYSLFALPILLLSFLRVNTQSDQTSFFLISGIPQVFQSKYGCFSVCGDGNPHAVSSLLIPVTQEPVPYKVLIICFFMPQHKIGHRIDAADLSPDKCLRTALVLRSRKFFHPQRVLPHIGQIAAESFRKHPELIHSVYSWPEIGLHLHGKINIILFCILISCFQNLSVPCFSKRRISHFHHDKISDQFQSLIPGPGQPLSPKNHVPLSPDISSLSCREPFLSDFNLTDTVKYQFFLLLTVLSHPFLRSESSSACF